MEENKNTKKRYMKHLEKANLDEELRDVENSLMIARKMSRIGEVPQEKGRYPVKILKWKRRMIILKKNEKL